MPTDQLGAVIEPLCGEATRPSSGIGYVPDEIEAQLSMRQASAVTYWGLLTGGVGAVIVVTVLLTRQLAITAYLSVQLSSASTGMCGLLAGAAVPTTRRRLWRCPRCIQVGRPLSTRSQMWNRGWRFGHHSQRRL
ncbi:MAG: hypothetical protein IPK17_10135 [Chloroflexi bacterium]|uniref:hypothetical protein n=1 Tax=Candidatus Flexifilum breve TaxID=3140694 RepID=UPI0031354D07|nr:hypothetical protein [Chloroflexota bacterium]